MNLRALALPGLLAVALASTSALDGGPVHAEGASSYAIDLSHSTVLFKIKHMGASWTYGRFNDFKGSFTIDDTNAANSAVSVEIQATSIDSNDEKRDNHLRSGDFFGVKQFPTISFKSSKVEKTADGYRATGELSLHGVKKTVAFDFHEVGRGEHPQKKVPIVGYEGSLVLKRSDYGMKTYLGGGVGDEVHITISVEGHGS